MTCRPSQAIRRLSAAFFILAAVFAVFPAPCALAADQPAASQPAASQADVERLIHTMEDGTERQKLVDQLKLLIAADKTAQEAEEPGLLSLLSDKIQDISDEVLDTASSLADVGRMASWVQKQLADPTLRAGWTEVLGKLAAIFGGGLVAEWLAMLILRAPRRLLERRQAPNRWLRLPLVAGRTVLELLPIIAFTIAAHSLRSVPSLVLDGNPLRATVMINMAYILTRFMLVSVQAVLMPGSSGIRVLPIDDETANYLFIWGRRLILSGVWGYFLVRALKLLGLPNSGYNFSFKLLGLVMTTLLVIFVLQNRQTVASWIRSQGAASGLLGKVQGLRNRLADVWHVLASLYIIASFCIWALQVKGGFEFIVRASLLTIVILAAANMLAGALAKLVDRAFAISEDLRRQFPHLEARANRYLAVMHNMVRGVVAFGTLLALAQAWGANTLAWLTSELGRHLISSTFSTAAVLIGALIVWELVNSSIERYLSQTGADGQAIQRSSRARTLLPLLRNVVMVVLIVFVALIVLSELGVNIAPLLAGAGVVGVAIGFGSQKLVQDVITGAFILFEDTIAVGDSVKIGEHTGTVEGMTIRTMRLRDLNGQVHTLPFSNVATVTNMSRDFGFHVFDIGVSYREDIDEVMGVMKQLGEEMAQDPDIGRNLIGEMEVFGIDKFADSAVVIRGRFKTLPGKQWMVGREFNRRVKRRFDELGISIPFPTTTLFFGEDRDGKAPPVHVQLAGGSAPQHHAPLPAFSGDKVNYPIGEAAKAD